MSKKLHLNNLFLLIILSAIWGSAFIAIKICVENIHPLSVASIRLIIGAVVLFFFLLFRKVKVNLSINDIILLCFIGLIGNFIPFVLISWAEIYIKSNTAGVLLSIGPIFALILSHFMTKDDKFTIIKLISILIGLLGVLFIIGFDTLNIFDTDDTKYLIPKVAIIISALGYVLSSIFAYNIKKIDSVTITAAVTISAAIISLPFLVIVEINYRSNFSISSLLPLLYLGIFPTAIAFLIRFYLISKTGPIFLSYVAYLIPVFAIIWGFIFLNETINLSTFIGVVLVLLGVFISQKKSMDKVSNNSISN